VAEPDYAGMKERISELWGLGDYARIAQILVPASRALVDATAISAGQEVLDVAAGSGNLAVLAAEEGADVTASDIAPGQVDLGRARTEAEGVDVDWVVADAEDLPFDDDRFDCAASVFGAMFGPRPDVVAGEMFRVVKPGGTVGLAVWGHYGSQAEVFEFLSRFGPPLPEGIPQPRDWGDEQIAEQRLGPLASSLQMERRTMRWEFESFDVMWKTLQSAGPAAASQRALSPEKMDEARRGVRDIVDRYNQADDSRVVVEPEYLQIVARKRG
jgi:2-polyprenyl-6-hydroxyphenyl methylase/3-demethylubiquinone-9 3-methyltransferase